MRKLVLVGSVSHGQILRFFDLGEGCEIPEIGNELEVCEEVCRFRKTQSLDLCTHYIKADDLKQLYLKCSISGIQIFTTTYRFRSVDESVVEFIKESIPCMDRKEAEFIRSKEIDFLCEESQKASFQHQ